MLIMNFNVFWPMFIACRGNELAALPQPGRQPLLNHAQIRQLEAVEQGRVTHAGKRPEDLLNKLADTRARPTGSVRKRRSPPAASNTVTSASGRITSTKTIPTVATAASVRCLRIDLISRLYNGVNRIAKDRSPQDRPVERPQDPAEGQRYCDNKEQGRLCLRRWEIPPGVGASPGPLARRHHARRCRSTSDVAQHPGEHHLMHSPQPIPEEQALDPGQASRLAGGENRDDVRLLQPCGEPYLTREALGARGPPPARGRSP